MGEHDYIKIVSILEQIFACKIDAPRPLEADLTFVPEANVDDLAVVKHFIINQHLLTEEYANSLIADQLSMLVLSEPLDSKQAYADYLTDLCAAVKYRVAAGYEYNSLLPTQQQLFELQDACLRFTGSYADLYVQYVQMCQDARITRYRYEEIKKCISADNYISAVDGKQRRELSERYLLELLQPYIDQGGICAHGHSNIDATTVNNIFYYKIAKQIFYYQTAKKLITATKRLADYGQLPQAQRTKLWQAICMNFPAYTPHDTSSIFYQFAQYIQETPGEIYSHFAKDLPEINHLSPERLYHVLQIAGLYCKKLVLVSRSVTENWHPKRFLSMQWQRKYPLQVITNRKTKTLRTANTLEQVRIWPNEMPYCPGHGLSICGNGLLEGFDMYGTFAYEWNIPQDVSAQIDNTPRDVEKLFREMKLFDSATQPICMFQNTIAYSTIIQTQHTHISASALDRWPIYNLPASETIELASARIEFVPVGSKKDAFYLRAIFDSLENEELIQYFIELNAALLQYAGGYDQLDAQLQIFRTVEGSGKFAFIYQPQALLLMQQNGEFLNPENHSTTLRKPQWVIPDGNDLDTCNNQFANGLEYLREYFDLICKAGTYQVTQEFTDQFQRSHQ